ncbi:hypothetical protein NQZ68_008384 [Dissostichus eleginoides]|nr:hypothetical protein NQZ68_008384 [Dissostichus eleginoides]
MTAPGSKTGAGKAFKHQDRLPASCKAEEKMTVGEQDYFLIPPSRSEINISTAVARRDARMNSTLTLHQELWSSERQREGDTLNYKYVAHMKATAHNHRAEAAQRPEVTPATLNDWASVGLPSSLTTSFLIWIHCVKSTVQS